MEMNSKIAPLKKPVKLPTVGNLTNQKMPAHLKAAGKKLWKHVSETFELEEHDLVLLESLCQTLDRKNQAENDLRDHGSLTFKNRHDELKPHPAIQIIRDCNILIARMRRELALSEDPPDNRPPKLHYGGRK
jgi:P27 family predicted phage terminase small subunit